MKIHSLDLLAQISAEIRKNGGKVVLALGCFDILHPGHVLHLQAARKLGDCLMVVVTPDEEVREQKGKGRPVFRCPERLLQLAALECVDYVTQNRGEPGFAIGQIKPKIYVKGSEYRNNMTDALEEERKAVWRNGGRLVFTDEPEFHSSDIIPTLIGGNHG